MSILTSHVLNEINRLGGHESARVLEQLLREYLAPERPRDEESLADSNLERVADALDPRRGNSPLGTAINVIPSSGPGASCCRLCVGVTAHGFSAKSSSYRVNFNQLAIQLSAHWLRCDGINEETLILTPDWNQSVFDSRYTDLFVAYRQIGKRAFIVEVARTGLILRWSC
jgi:hypothetical protein